MGTINGRRAPAKGSMLHLLNNEYVGRGEKAGWN